MPFTEPTTEYTPPALSSGVFTDTTSHDVAVSVRGLSKSYSIARNAVQHSTMGEALMHKLKNPLAKPERETFWALNDVNFDIQKGDVVGIIGRNGAGKSTLLKILSRITEPTKGRIDLYGRVGSLLEVGTGFHAELTGRENIYLNGAILGMKKSEIARQFDAIVEFSGTEQFLDTPVKRYSSGMYVRLAFAVAAHLNPEILIVDEVLAVGDAEFQKKCLGKMQDVADSGRTVLFVSHNMTAVRNLCSKGMVLAKGNLQMVGGINDAIDNYTHHFANGDTPITDFISKCHPSVRVHDISVNGVSSHEVMLPSENTVLDLRICGQIFDPMRIDLEVWLTDMNESPLAFYGAGHEHGMTAPRPVGPFQINKKLELPGCLNQGDYWLNISLTDHNICGWVDCYRGVRLSVEGVPTATGRPLEYKDGKGFLRLREIATLGVR
jgi:lipopolysaccharide transport system ATP-binding protein